MWDGYELALCAYTRAIIKEWIGRGYKDSCMQRLEIWEKIAILNCEYKWPPWLNDKFFTAHKSNLLRKDPVWYGQFNWNVPSDIPYWWPSKEIING